MPSLLTVSPSLRTGAHKHFAAGAYFVLVYKDRIPRQGLLCSRW